MPINLIKIKIRFVVEPDGDEFHAFCPELKGLHAPGKTEQEALSNAKDAAIAYFRSLIKHNDPIPVGMLDVEEFRTFGSAFKHIFAKKFSRKPRAHSVIQELSFAA